MDLRQFEANAVAAPPDPPAAPSEGYPTNGDPGSAQAATTPGDYWFYQISAELREVITQAGLMPDHTDLTQLYSAIQTLIANNLDSPGTIKSFAFETVPTGFLECDGSAISRTTYANLFSAIGTVFGAGDGATTFNIPDLRGEFLRGWDHGRGADPDAAGRANGGDAVGSTQESAQQQITGSFGDVMATNNTAASSSGAFDHNPVVNSGQAGPNSREILRPQFDNSAVARTSTEDRPRNISMMFCIKY